MLSPEDLHRLRQKALEQLRRDQVSLDSLRERARGLREQTRRIRPRNATTVAVVATDAGEGSIEFNPLLLQPVRVVDNYGEVRFLDILSPYEDVQKLSQRLLEDPSSPLGRLMRDLGLKGLWELSPMIPKPGAPLDERKLGWVKVYRDLAEWASLYDFITGRDFPSHTLVLRDGLLRSKIFTPGTFETLWERIRKRVEGLASRGKKIYVVGIAKRSKVMERYRLAFYLEGVLRDRGAAYLSVPPELEREVYRWEEYARGEAEGSWEHFVQGRLHLAKFGEEPYAPIWPVDVWEPQVGEADEVMGFLLQDARAGFPIPDYPLSLQQAHLQARIGGLDREMLQELVFEALRHTLGEKGGLEEFLLLQSKESMQQNPRG